MKKLLLLLLIFMFPYALNSHFQDELFFSNYVEPEVIIIFDVSGSMTYDINGCPTYGDGAHGNVGGRDMDGDGLPNDSRMYITKAALHEVVPEFHFRWGLFKFLQKSTNKAHGPLSQFMDLRTDCDGDSDNLYPSSSRCSPRLYLDGGYSHSCSDERILYDYDRWTDTWRDFYVDRVEINYENLTSTDAVDAFELVVTPAEGAPSHINSIQEWLDNKILGSPKELAPVGGTPIPGALRGARYNYFMDEIPGDKAKKCRKYFIILVTDGEPTYGIDPDTYNQGENALWAGDGSTVETLWQQQSWWEADSLRHISLEDTVYEVQTYVIGVGIASATLDSIAKYGGTENRVVDSLYYYPAFSPQDIIEAFRNISADIYDKATSFSVGEVTSIEEDYISTEYEAKMYLATFYPAEADPFWEGHLRKFKVAEGGLSLDSIPDSLLIWDAGNLLRNRSPSARDIYGIDSVGSLLSFTASNFEPEALDLVSSGAGDTVINLVRNGVPDARSISYLGDIFHSAPLRVKTPNLMYIDDGFTAYRDSVNKVRPAVIYAGSNTGMLHAFDDSTGVELFSVIPKNFVRQVKDLRDSHRFYVDADPMAADVWFPTSSTDSFKDWDEWKTVLMAAQGEGGREITALDVTYPDYSGYPKHLFTFDDDTMGMTTSVPVIFKIAREIGSDTVERFFAFFGGGEPDSLYYDRYNPLSSDSLRGNVIVALDVEAAATDVNGPEYNINYWYIQPATGDESKMVYPFVSAANLINLNERMDNRYDLLYIPDLAGQLWKVDLRDPDISKWRAKCIFQPPIPTKAAEDAAGNIPSQPAFYAPYIEKEAPVRGLWLFYGTGDRSRVFKTGTDNRFYAILDTLADDSNLDYYPIVEGNLKNVLTEGFFRFPSDLSTYKGWYLAFSDSGHTDEKVVSQAVLLADTLSFVTFDPDKTADICNPATGFAREYLLNFRSGRGRYRDMGSGLPQAPRYTYNSDDELLKINQTSDSLWIEKLTGYGREKRIFRWMER